MACLDCEGGVFEHILKKKKVEEHGDEEESSDDDEDSDESSEEEDQITSNSSTSITSSIEIAPPSTPTPIAADDDSEKTDEISDHDMENQENEDDWQRLYEMSKLTEAEKEAIDENFDEEESESEVNFVVEEEDEFGETDREIRRITEQAAIAKRFSFESDSD